MERVVNGFEITGVAILVVGSLVAFVSAASALRGGDRRVAYQRARTQCRPGDSAGPEGLDHRRHRADDHGRSHIRQRPSRSG
jgi:hypothetical protein